MKKIILIFLVSISGFSQCISGDCNNGFGKYDFGFAVYEGNFQSGKPNGQGTMDYGGGEKFVGNFKDGQEDGDGKLYKKNIPLDVTYTNGKVKVRQEKTIIGGNAPVVKGCLQGDCYNNFGVLKFDSGNRYEGNFVYGNKSGQGKFIWADGNIFTGNFENNNYNQGSYLYAQENVTFNGTFDIDGNPKTGDYKYPNFKSTVSIINGKISKVDNPVARRADSLAIEAKKDKPCPKCSGKGMSEGYAYQSANTDWSTVYHVTSSGTFTGGSTTYAPSGYTTKYTAPSICSECRGTGKVFGGNQIIKSKGY